MEKERWLRNFYTGASQKRSSRISHLKSCFCSLTQDREDHLPGVLQTAKRKLIEEIKSAKAGKPKNPIKTHVRDLIILPYMVDITVNVFSGKEFQPVNITTEMIGHYLGEYVITNKRVSHGAPGVGASRSSLYVPLK